MTAPPCFFHPAVDRACREEAAAALLIIVSRACDDSDQPGFWVLTFSSVRGSLCPLPTTGGKGRREKVCERSPAYFWLLSSPMLSRAPGGRGALRMASLSLLVLLVLEVRRHYQHRHTQFSPCGSLMDKMGVLSNFPPKKVVVPPLAFTRD
eukprot:scaffold31802_cov78-Skeletonema_dohrnii-CCMP3373.AAC.2